MNASPTTPNHKGHDKDTNFTMRIKPNFDLSTIQADDIKAEAEHHLKVASDNGAATKNPFPVAAFPAPVQQIISETNDSLNFPIDFTGAALLHTAALAIGNTYEIRIKNTWTESPILYTALVSRSGKIKTPPLKFALQPLMEKDKATYSDYKEHSREYKNYQKLSKEERKRENLSEPDVPVWLKHILQDYTPEALIEAHSFNKRGIGVYSDELAGWFKNFNKYNKGSEEQFWLSSWSKTQITVDRKNSDPILIPNPFISVIGGIQNGVLEELKKGSKGQNGFIDRILFAFPDHLTSPKFSDQDLNNSIVIIWQDIVARLMSLPCLLDETGNPEPKILEFAPEAKTIFIKWFDRNAELMDEAENDSIASLYAKLNQYVLRFSLTMELLQWACGESEKENIGVDAVNGAIKLAEYFRNTALKVHEIVSDPLAGLAADKKVLFLELPDVFKTAEGIKIAEGLEIPKDTFHKDLGRFQENGFIEKLSQGKYKKLK